jgi:hypothetical protein
MPRAILIAALLIASPLLGQTPVVNNPQTQLGSATKSVSPDANTPETQRGTATEAAVPGVNSAPVPLGTATKSVSPDANTPQTQRGTATEAAVPGVNSAPAKLGTATESAVVPQAGAVATAPPVSEAPHPDAAPPAKRQFDLNAPPVTATPSTHGSLADTSTSLGTYARKVRVQEQKAATEAAPDASAQPKHSE